MNPRITMQTKPLSPFCATSYPDFVSTLMVARPEMFAGAALFANAISFAWGIRYSSIGGYLGLCAWAIPGHTAANNTAYIRIAFIVVNGLLSRISLHPLIRIWETLGYGELTSDAHRTLGVSI